MPYPALNIDDFSTLVEYVNTNIIPNGIQDITGEEENNVFNNLFKLLPFNGVKAKLINSPTNYSTTTDDRILIFLEDSITSTLVFDNNFWNQFTFCNLSSENIELEGSLEYINAAGDVLTHIPANNIVSIIKGEDDNWYSISSSEGVKTLGGIKGDIGIGQGFIINGQNLNLDLVSKTLVTPSISTSYNLFLNNGITPYVPPTSNSRSLVVDVGVKAFISATYIYVIPNSNYVGPTSISGSWGSSNPGSGNNSSVFNNSNNAITTDSVFSVNFAKPKSGLIVVSGQVQFPSGNDTTGDAIGIYFRYRGFLGFSSSSSLDSDGIRALARVSFQDNRSRTEFNVSAGSTEYTYYCYPASFGFLYSIIQNSALPILGAFSYIGIVSLVTDGGINVNYYVYKSNATNAFTNVRLDFN